MRAIVLHLIFILTSIGKHLSNSQSLINNTSCLSKTTCIDCIRIFGCAWCSDPDFESNRCQSETKLKCISSYIINPKPEVTAVIRYPVTEINTKNLTYARKIVDLSPQMINLKIRPNYPYEIILKFRQTISGQEEKVDSLTVEMREKNLGNIIEVRYYSNCSKTNQIRVETDRCENVNAGQIVEFVINIRLIECPINPNDWKRQFYIYPVGSNKNLTVDVDMICDCPCQYSGHRSYEDKSEKCSGHGTLKCGICECDPYYAADDCSCYYGINRTNSCRSNSTAPICSDRGICKCNKCDCITYSLFEAFTGEFCECANFTCPRVLDRLCSGNGNCVCNKCLCYQGWTGDDCSISCNNDSSICLF